RKSARPCGDRCQCRQEGRQNATAAGSSNFGESEGGQEPLPPATSLRLSASKPTTRTSHDYTHLSSENGLFNRKGRFCFLAGSRKPAACYPVTPAVRSWPCIWSRWPDAGVRGWALGEDKHHYRGRFRWSC